MKVYFETLAKANRYCAGDKVLYPDRKTSGNRDVMNYQTSYQARLLVGLLTSVM